MPGISYSMCPPKSFLSSVRWARVFPEQSRGRPQINSLLIAPFVGGLKICSRQIIGRELCLLCNTIAAHSHGFGGGAPQLGGTCVCGTLLRQQRRTGECVLLEAREGPGRMTIRFSIRWRECGARGHGFAGAAVAGCRRDRGAAQRAQAAHSRAGPTSRMPLRLPVSPASFAGPSISAEVDLKVSGPCLQDGQRRRKGELRVVRAVNANHFLEVVNEGFLNMTTVYDVDPQRRRTRRCIRATSASSGSRDCAVLWVLREKR